MMPIGILFSGSPAIACCDDPSSAQMQFENEAMPGPDGGNDLIAEGLLLTYTQSPGNLHYLTLEEADFLKAAVGTYDPMEEYNLLIEDHGTGLSPPTEAEWGEMVGSLVVLEAGEMTTLSLPTSYDLSTDLYFPEVRSQGGQGSCAAWAVTYYAYGYLEAKDNEWIDASTGNDAHLMSPAFTYNMVNGGYDSGSSMNSNSKIIRDWGVPSLANMGYDWHDYTSWGNESAWREAPLHRSYDSHSISYSGDSTVDTVKDLVSSGTPVVFAIDAGEYTPGFSDGNYLISSSEYDSSTINHAQTVVGYDDSCADDEDTGAFKVVNSWGSGWGDNGYYWITYEAFKEIGNLLCLRYLVDINDYAPSILTTWEFDSAPTREADFEVGIGSYSSPVDYIEPYYSKNGNGYTHTFPDFMCLDITKFQPYYNMGNQDFYLEISSSNTAGDTSSFRIEIYSGGYVPEAFTQRSSESPDVPMTNPGYVTNTMDTSEDITSPSISISSPTEGQVLASTSLVIEWSGSDSGSGIDHYEIRMDSSPWTDVGTQTSYAFTDLNQGSHSVQVKAHDCSGNNATDSASFQVDTLAPQLIITSPLNGSVTNVTSVSVEWTGSDSGTGIDYYHLRLDQGSWSYMGVQTFHACTDLTEGEHTVEVRAVDGANNYVIEVVSLSIDSISPVVTISSPQDGAVLDQLTFTASWTATDSGGIDRYEVRVDDGQWTDFGVQLTTSLTLDEGEHTVEVRAFDNAGNCDSDSVGIELDVTDPLVNILDPSEGEIFNSSQLAVSWWGSDSGSGIDHYEIRIDGGSWSSLGMGTSTQLDLDDGVHTVEVRAMDHAGNSGNDAITIIVDTAAPIVDITSPSAQYINSSSVTLEWQGSDQGKGISAYHLYLDDLLVQSGVQTSYQLQSIPDGWHHLELVAEDLAGNTALDETWFTVDTVDPIVIMISPTEGEQIDSQQFEVSWMGSDGTSGILGYWVNIDGSGWEYMGSADRTDVGPLMDGYHDLEVRAMDRAGNLATDSVQFTVWSGTLEIGITSPLEGDIISTADVTVRWTFIGSPFGLDHFEVRVDGGQWMDVGSQTSCFLSNLSTVEHTVEVLVVDGEDHTGSDMVNFQVDQVSPSVTVTSPSEGSCVNTSFIILDWAVEEVGSGIASVEVRLDFGSWVLTGRNTHTFTSLSAGQHSAEIRAIDAAGNQGTTMVNFTIATMDLGVEILFPEQWELFDHDDIEVIWSGNDSGSGIDHFEVKVDDDQWKDLGLNDSLDLVEIDDGTHVIVVRIFDGSGENRTASVEFTIDTTAPIVVITSNFPRPTNMTTVTMEWTGSDSGTGIDHYLFRLDSGGWQTTTLDHAILIDLEDGSHTLEVMAMDPVGNSGVDSLSFTVDTVAPTIQILGPAEGAFLGHGTVDIDFETSGLDEGSVIEICVDGDSWTEVALDEAIQFEFHDEGEHGINMRAIDCAGNAAIDSVTIILDMTPPELSIVCPLDGLETNDSSLILSWEAFDVLSPDVTIEISINGSDWYEVDGTSRSLEDLDDGYHHLMMRAADRSGNLVIKEINFTVDTTPPELQMIYPIPGAVIDQASFIIEWSVDDRTTSVSTVEFHTGTGDWQDATGISSVMTSLVDGEHTVTVRVLDTVGNILTEQVTFLVDTTPPVAGFISPETGAIVNTSSVLIEWDIDDLSSGPCSSTISIDGGHWNELDLSTSFLATPDGEGEHLISLRVTDVALHSVDITMVIFLDTVSPTVSSLSPQGDQVNAETRISVSFSEPMDKNRVEITVAGVQGTLTWNGQNVSYIPTAPLEYGSSYTVQVSGRDLAGNAMSPTTWVFQTISTVTISGTILDEMDQPVVDALVTLDTGATTTTDDNGNFILESPPGIHTIVISKEGFQGQTMDVEVANGQTQVNGYLESEGSAFPGMSVVIIGALIVFAFLGIQLAIMRRKHR